MSGINKAREDMYLDYCNEMQRFDPTPHGKISANIQARSVFRRYLRKKWFTWTDIYDENKKLIGFLITAKNLNLHGEGLYICEAYVILEYRGSGFMERALMDIFDGHTGPVFLEVFNTNRIALRFWNNIAHKLNAKLISANPSPSGIPGLTEYKYFIDKVTDNKK